MLEIENLRKTYRTPRGLVTPLDGLSMSVRAGEFVAVCGPSGCGKTTLLLCAGGLLHPDAGKVRVGGHDLYGMAPEERARFRAASIGFVFQQFHLIPYLSVLDNVLAAALESPPAGVRERARELLRRFGLAARQDHLPAQLSTGEQQRTALARALLHCPKLLLADEPTGNLDDENGMGVLRHLAACATDGAAVLLVTHDPRAAELAERIIRLPLAA